MYACVVMDLNAPIICPNVGLVGAALVAAPVSAVPSIRGGDKPRPYGGGIVNNHTRMKMIWHDHVNPRFDMGKPLDDCLPFSHHHLPGFVQNHFAIHDFPEQRRAVLAHNCHEIRSGLGTPCGDK